MKHSLANLAGCGHRLTERIVDRRMASKVTDGPKSHEHGRFGWVMSSRPVRAVSCVVVLLLMSISPVLTTVSAHDSVLLSTDVQHVVLQPGQSTNVTLTIENNGSSITSYNLTVDASSLATVWEVVNVDATVTNVFPTWSKNTTLIVRLTEGATVADSGSFDVTATNTDTNASTSITVHVSVAPSYHPSIESTNQGLVPMAAGASNNLAFTVSNLGTVTDTLLLDIEVAPDLSGWWANQSSSSNTTNNSTSPSLNVLMYGNSYTGSNNLGSLVDSVLVADGYNASVTALTGGGLRLPAHWQNMNTSGHQWNTTLRSSSWDYVVLQDQSQVPSFPTTESMWQESRNASVNLSTEIEAEGGETVLFLTWGYRDGDSLNSFNNNFTTMQERLLQGYTRYAENISAAGNTVWMAPVGLAFKTVHDAVVADGDDPTAAGNLFYDLYTSDGSHPSLAGSYLAACVLHASMTGDVCSGSADTVNLNASTKLALQEAADDTVFNQTTGMSYYPWEVGGTSAFGLGSSVPAGWYLQWMDDELPNMAAGSSQTATLSVTVPSDAAPDYYGYRLTVGSTNGNITGSTLLVIEVEEDASVALAFLQQADSFLPGVSTQTGVQVTNTGNTPLNLTWGVETSPTSLCGVSMVDAETTGLLPDDVVDVGLNVDIHPTADSSDVCDVTLSAHAMDGSTMVELAELAFAINVDEAVNFSLTGPSSQVVFVPETGTDYEVRIHNHGSDEAAFYLDILSSPGLQTVMVSASSVTVPADDTGVWTVRTTADTALSGTFLQSFSATYASQTNSVDVEVLLSEVDAFALTGPTEDRVLVEPGSAATLNMTLDNTGTSNLTLSPTLSGLPVGVTVSELGEVAINRSSTAQVRLDFTASLGASPSTSTVTLTYTGDGVSQSYSFDFIVLDRAEVIVTSLQSRLLANPVDITSMTVDITNLGTQSDVFVVDWSSATSSTWFDFTVTPTTFQLEAGATQVVTVGVREVQQGAPSSGVDYDLSVTSTSDPSNNDAVSVRVESVVSNANITVFNDQASAKPGQSVYGSVILTNTGNTDDTFTITTVGTDCGLDTSVTLAPGLSSDALGWSCIVANDAQAGQQGIVFRAVSSVRSNVAVEQAAYFTVEADWPGDALVALTFEASQISLGVDSSTSTVLTVQNLANTDVSGTLDVLGQDTGVLILEWVRLSDQTATQEYSLTAGSTVEFKLTVISNTARTANAEVVVRATSSGGGVLTTDQSVPLMVTVEGPALPPNGLALPLGLSVSQPVTLGVMGLGWLVAILAVRTLRRRPGGDDVDFTEEVVEEEEEEPEKDVPELGYNECRLDGESKVNCPTCDARLGVPRGSVPPFRFTCPQCSNKIRVVE
jgi:uncharacterized membrane protein